MCRVGVPGATVSSTQVWIPLNDDHLLDAGPLVLAPDARIIMAKSADPAINGGLPDVAHAFGDAYSLTNTGDDFILRCGDVDIDAVSFDPMTWPFAVGVAMQLGPDQRDATANDLPTAWCAATLEYTPGNTGTPGAAANPPCR